MKMLITGGSGFLGRGILRRAHQGALDWDITVYSRDETKQDLCRARYPQARYILGDVRDLDRLRLAMSGHDAVIHGGAMKYIVDAEMNASECVSVNAMGSGVVIRAAQEAGVKAVVGVSTDKAVQPVNIYGCTKMVMERMFAETAQWFSQSTVFSCVRYGNVVGSTGSVIPLFFQQLAENGEVSLTNPNMTRFWMGVEEAIDLIVLAMARQHPGSIFVPLARAMTMLDVAKAVGGEDVPIKIVGERPGEKLHESLIHYEESVRTLRLEDPFPHFELVPPGNRVGEVPFTLSSHTPNDWMAPEKLRGLIEDAKTI